MKDQITIPPVPWSATEQTNDPLSRVSISAIHRRIAEKHGIVPGTLRKRCRKDHLVKARFEVFATAFEAGYSMHQIGRAYKMDHSSVLYGIRQHNGTRPKQ
ncbi:MAG: helix-turn-helix domain-containing protein [Chloroflexota bacterium]